jgi:uncharacterized protein with PIN domain
VFWKGSHWQRMAGVLDTVLAPVESADAPD